LDFVDKIRARVGQAGHHDEAPAARRLSAAQLVRVQSAVAAHYGVDPWTFRKRCDESISRDVAAWLSRELTSCTLRELAAVFGLGHADSVCNLTRRVEAMSHQLSAISHQPSAISHQPSAISHQPSAISHQPSAISADSVCNLTRRAQRALPDSSRLRRDIAAIRQTRLKTERI